MISDALFLAERPDGLAAGLLLGDQLAPILALLVGHPPKMPHLQPAAEGWITRRLLLSVFIRHTIAISRDNAKSTHNHVSDRFKISCRAEVVLGTASFRETVPSVAIARTSAD